LGRWNFSGGPLHLEGIMSPFIVLIACLILVGVLIWAAQRILAVLPVAEPFKTIVYVLIVVVAAFYCVHLLMAVSWSSFRLP
jgi:hypothetical protein